MASDAKNAPALTDPRLSAAEVRGFLKSNPDFLAENAELLQILLPPTNQQGDNVLDMQQFMVERLQPAILAIGHVDESLRAHSYGVSDDELTWAGPA